MLTCRLQHGVPRASGFVDRSEAARKKEVKRIEAYKGLVKGVQATVWNEICLFYATKQLLRTWQIDAKEYTADALTSTSTLLSQNPEYYTIWNDRRLILQDVFSKELAAESATSPAESASSSGLNTAQQEILLLIQEDLAFLLPLLENFPKCYWIWNHRAWLLQEASEYLPISSSKRLWQEELGLVGKMLNYDSRNFHGWSYRRQVVQALERLNTQDHNQKQDEKDAPPTMTEHEFAYTTKMINASLSNFSAWHNRLQLIPKLLAERHADAQARRSLLDDEFALITRALYTDPYDQSVWFYYNYLMSTLAPNLPETSTIVLDLTSQERLEYFRVQLDTLKDILEGADDCKYIFQALLTYTAQYLEIDANDKAATTVEMTSWLEQLEKLDPLRKGRWQDLRIALNL